MPELPAPDPPVAVVATSDTGARAAEPVAVTPPTPRAGDLTPGWRVTVIATWIMVFFAYAALWKASEEIGIGTWWLGSRSQPTLIVVRLLPFALAIGVAVAAAYNARRLPLVGVTASLLIGVSAVMEVIGRWSLGLALVEGGIALGALLVSLGSLTGRYAPAPETSRSAAPAAPDTDDADTDDADTTTLPPPTPDTDDPDTTSFAPPTPDTDDADTTTLAPPTPDGSQVPGEDSPG